MSHHSIARTTRLVTMAAAGSLLVGALGAAGSTAFAAAPTTTPPDESGQMSTVAESPISLPATWRKSAPAASQQRPSRSASARQAVVVQQARLTAFTLRSKQTRDMRGVERSLYRGKYFNEVSESKRLCIVERESEGFYDVINPGGNYFGAYQVSRPLARGATWMMLKEHKKLMGAKQAKRVLSTLRSKPMNTWPRYWQDAAFHTVINWNGTLSGASHWAGGRWHC